MSVYADIHGDKIPLEINHVEFWSAEFIENWKCSKTHVYHYKGETFRMHADPNTYKNRFISTRADRGGLEYQVPFSVLSFRYVKHAIYTLHHKITEITEVTIDCDENN